MRLFRYFIIATLLTSTTPTFASQPAHEASAGITLYNQLKLDAAFPVLEEEAQAGNVESQYYLGEALRKRNRYMTPEAQHWYETAAMNGSIYAMIQLGRKNSDLCKIMDNCPASSKSPAQWFAYAKELALANANRGDAESLFLMYEITLNDEWLEKSANAGYPLAQYWMAVSERQGKGFFFIPGKRDESVRNWLRLSSEGGYPKAMNNYLEILYRDGDMQAVHHWLKIAAETGEQDAMSNYGAYISHTPDKIGYPLNLVEGYAMFYLMKDLNDAGGIQDYVDRKIEKIAEKMTPEQIEQSKVFAKQWKDTHPPVSFFPDKLGD